MQLRALTEGAIMVALAFVLSFVKLYELPNGGSFLYFFPHKLNQLIYIRLLKLLCVRINTSSLFDVVVIDDLVMLSVNLLTPLSSNIVT